MAFDISRFNVWVDSIGGGGLRAHSYQTTDDEETVLAAGYFNKIAQHGVRLHDLIIVTFETSNKHGVGQVASITASEVGQVVFIDVNGSGSIIITGYQTIAALTGVTPPGVPVRMDQYLRALEASGAGRKDNLYNAVDTSASNAVSYALLHAERVPEGGLLATFTATTFGLSPTEMTAIFTAARPLTL